MSNKPTHTAYVVRNFEKKKDGGETEDAANWSRIGVAFEHRDRKGYDVLLDAVPVNGKVVLRLNDLKADKA